MMGWHRTGENIERESFDFMGFIIGCISRDTWDELRATALQPTTRECPYVLQLASHYKLLYQSPHLLQYKIFGQSALTVICCNLWIFPWTANTQQSELVMRQFTDSKARGLVKTQKISESWKIFNVDRFFATKTKRKIFSNDHSNLISAFTN